MGSRTIRRSVEFASQARFQLQLVAGRFLSSYVVFKSVLSVGDLRFDADFLVWNWLVVKDLG